MKDKALKYLNRNPLLFAGMINPILRNTAEILYADEDGILIHEKVSDGYMVSAPTLEKGKQLLSNIRHCKLIACHEDFLVDYIKNKYKLPQQLTCYQLIYPQKDPISMKDRLRIKELTSTDIPFIMKNYDKLSLEEITKIIELKHLFGGYIHDTLVGFVGSHLEGSMGLLEIFKEYRGNGYGIELEIFMINRFLEKGLTPFAQVETDNIISLNLQKKLGLIPSETPVYWMF